MIDTVLFDFDGVVADTEPSYDLFWNSKAEKFNLGFENFAAMIKGETLRNILGEYFKCASDSEKAAIAKDLDAFEQEMPYKEIPGSANFIRILKERGFKLGLVTSSSMHKMKYALVKLGLENCFDAIVTGDSIKEGKPNPQCYITAAQMLKSDPSNCAVFEDSINGMRAALGAKMRLFALSTTLPMEKIKMYSNTIFENFSNSQKILEALGEKG
jgi:HAD hydrolase, family IA, variant 3